MATERREFRLNLLDRAIVAVAPQWGLERAAAKERAHYFGYDAATPGKHRRHSGGASKNSNPENWTAQRDTVEIMWAARALEKKSPLLVGMLDRLALYVCGQITYRASTEDEAVNREYEQYFHEWCGKCDLTGRFRLAHLVQQSFRGMLRDGDAGLVLERREAGWKLNAIEADRIGNPTSPVRNNERIFRGVHLDEDGAPELYDIYKRSLNSQYTLEAQVPPERMLHLMDPLRTRPGQYRPPSLLAQALPKIQDLHEIFQNEMVAHKNASKFAGFFRGGSGFQWNKEEADSTGTKRGVLNIESGTMMNLAADENISFAPALQRPGGAFMELVRSEIREVATSLRLPFGFLYDLTMLGGVTARLEVRLAERTIQNWQGLIEEFILNRVRDLVLGSAVARREITPRKDYKMGEWSFGPFITADVGHEANADLSMLAAGCRSRSEIAQKHGTTVPAIARNLGNEVATFQRVAGETKIPVELMVANLPNATQLLAAMNTPPEAEEEEQPEPPPPGMIGSVGEKGVAPLLQVVEGVSQGTIDREAGVLSLMEIYGWDLAKAQMVLPVAAPAAPPVAAET